MKIKEVIDMEIAFWASMNPFYARYFKHDLVKNLIMLCEALPEITEVSNKMISDFIAGLALIPIYLKNKDERQEQQVDELTKPMLDLIIAHVTSDNFLKQLIEMEVSGESVLNIDGVTTPISIKEILIHIRRSKSFPLTSKQIASIERDWIKYKREQYQFNPLSSKESKTDKLKTCLTQYSFFDLHMVKQLTPTNQEKLVELLIANGLPYSIAMFDYIGFIKYLDKEHFKSSYKRNRAISNWFDSDKDGRAVRGYVNSMLTNPEKGRYKAHLHKEKVQKDFQTLK